MGLRDILTGRHQVAPPAPDRLFALTTANVTLEAELGIRSAGVAGIVFQALSTADFAALVSDMETLVRSTATDSGATVVSEDDSYGFRWMILRTDGVEDQVVGINAVSSSLETGGFGERLLCAVFAFTDPSGASLYWIYNYKRGAWYPFVPAPGGTAGEAGAQQRSTERELQLKAQIGHELPIEAELERWFPLWGIPF